MLQTKGISSEDINRMRNPLKRKKNQGIDWKVQKCLRKKPLVGSKQELNPSNAYLHQELHCM